LRNRQLLGNLLCVLLPKRLTSFNNAEHA